MNTGPSSFVDVAVYPNQTVADNNKEARQKFHDNVFGLCLKMNSIMKAKLTIFTSLRAFKSSGFRRDFIEIDLKIISIQHKPNSC